MFKLFSSPEMQPDLVCKGLSDTGYCFRKSSNYLKYSFVSLFTPSPQFYICTRTVSILFTLMENCMVT